MTQQSLNVINSLEDDIEELRKKKKRLQDKVQAEEAGEDEKEDLREVKRHIQTVRAELEAYQNGHIYRSE